MTVNPVRIALAGFAAGVLLASGISGIYVPAAMTAPLDKISEQTEISREFRAAVATDIAFPAKSHELSDAAEHRIRAQAQWIKANPGVQFAVTGQSGTTGHAGTDRDLGLRRANAVVSALVEHGVPEQRLMALVTMDRTAPETMSDITVTEVLGFVRQTPDQQRTAGFLGGQSFVHFFKLNGA